MESTYQISFPEQSVGRANQSAAELMGTLRERARGVDVRAIKGRQNTQDAGTVLHVVLNATAIVAVAKGIEVWLGRSRTKVRIRLPDGTEADVDSSSDNVAAMLQAIFQRAKPGK